MALIHFTKYNPNIFPWKSSLCQLSVPRVQSIDKSTALGFEKKKEVGRSTNDGVVGSKKTTPAVTLGISETEYGSIDLFKYLAGKDSTSLDLDDFTGNALEFVSYLTDDNDTFIGSKWYSNMRLNGFGVSAGDPDSELERSVDLVGEKDRTLQEDNKYFIWKCEDEIESGASGLSSAGTWEISVSNPDAVQDPDTTASAVEDRYILIVVRDRDGEVTKLVQGTDYTYSSITKILSVLNCEVGDIIKYGYSATTQGTQTLWTDNDSDPASISADSVEIYLYIPSAGKPGVADYVYRLQSGSLDVSFDRLDVKEWGNKDVVLRGIKSKTVTIGLGRFAISNAIEEVLRGAGADYGILDVEQFATNIKWVMKIYEDNTKSTFKLGFKATGLSPTGLDHAIAVDDYKTIDNTLEGEALLITSVEADLTDS